MSGVGTSIGAHERSGNRIHGSMLHRASGQFLTFSSNAGGSICQARLTVDVMVQSARSTRRHVFPFEDGGSPRVVETSVNVEDEHIFAQRLVPLELTWLETVLSAGLGDERAIVDLVSVRLPEGRDDLGKVLRGRQW